MTDSNTNPEPQWTTSASTSQTDAAHQTDSQGYFLDPHSRFQTQLLECGPHSNQSAPYPQAIENYQSTIEDPQYTTWPQSMVQDTHTHAMQLQNGYPWNPPALLSQPATPGFTGSLYPIQSTNPDYALNSMTDVMSTYPSSQNLSPSQDYFDDQSLQILDMPNVPDSLLQNSAMAIAMHTIAIPLLNMGFTPNPLFAGLPDIKYEGPMPPWNQDIDVETGAGSLFQTCDGGFPMTHMPMQIGTENGAGSSVPMSGGDLSGISTSMGYLPVVSDPLAISPTIPRTGAQPVKENTNTSTSYPKGVFFHRYDPTSKHPDGRRYNSIHQLKDAIAKEAAFQATSRH